MHHCCLRALLPLLVLASTSTLLAQNSQLYYRAVDEYDNGNYPASCTDLQSLYAATNKFHDLPADVIRKEKSFGLMTPTWTHRALDSDNHQRYAQECVEFMRRGLSDAAFNDFGLVEDAHMYADRAIAHPGATGAASAPAPAALSSRAASRAPQSNRALYTPPSRPAARPTPAPAPQPSAAAASSTAGRGNLPDGDYKCYTATTATILAGGSATLNPGQFLTHIHIKGNTYQAYEDPAGHYTVGPDGRITWNGGSYSSKTLGRYIIDRGEPAIVIGYADTDAGAVCKR